MRYLDLRSWKWGRARWLGALALAAGAASLVVTLVPRALACGGTPPPFRCGFAYNFAVGGDFNLVAGNDPVNVRLDTFHLLALLGFPPNACPPGPYRATIVVDIDGAGLNPFVFKNIDLAEGENTVPLDFQVVPGAARQSSIHVTSDVTFIDGRVLRQEATHPFCIVPGTDGVADIEVVPVDLQSSQALLPPGGQARVAYDIINNTGQTLIRDIVVQTRNAADLAETIVGNNDTNFGTFSIGDPVGDALEVAFRQDLDGGCFPESDVPPFQRVMGEARRTFELMPGPNRVEFAFNAPGPCGNGKCDHGSLLVIAGTNTVEACAALIPVVSHAMEPTECPRAGYAAMAGVGGGQGFAGIGVQSPIPNQPWQANVDVNPGDSFFLVNGQSRGAQFFSSVTTREDQLGRVATDYSFFNPPAGPEDIIDGFFAFDVRPAPGSEGTIATQVLGAHVEDGAPTNTPDAPFHIMDTFVEGLANGAENTTIETLHQISVIVVTESFRFFPGEVLLYEVSAGPNGFIAHVKTRIREGQTTENIIGFTVFHDLRSFVEYFRIRGDMNCDGRVDGYDVDALELAVDDPEAFEDEYPDCRRSAGDLDGDGDVDEDDLDIFYDEIEDDDSSSR